MFSVKLLIGSQGSRLEASMKGRNDSNIPPSNLMTDNMRKGIDSIGEMLKKTPPVRGENVKNIMNNIEATNNILTQQKTLEKMQNSQNSMLMNIKNSVVNLINITPTAKMFPHFDMNKVKVSPSSFFAPKQPEQCSIQETAEDYCLEIYIRNQAFSAQEASPGHVCAAIHHGDKQLMIDMNPKTGFFTFATCYPGEPANYDHKLEIERETADIIYRKKLTKEEYQTLEASHAKYLKEISDKQLKYATTAKIYTPYEKLLTGEFLSKNQHKKELLSVDPDFSDYTFPLKPSLFPVSPHGFYSNHDLPKVTNCVHSVHDYFVNLVTKNVEAPAKTALPGVYATVLENSGEFEKIIPGKCNLSKNKKNESGPRQD